MGYIYKVYETDKKTYRRFIPKRFTESMENELLYFDYLACIAEDPIIFYNRIKKDDKKFENADIVRVTIGLTEANSGYVEYNPVFNNKYIEKLFEVKNNKFTSIRVNKLDNKKNSDEKEKILDRATIETNSEVYNEMLSFLYKYLKDRKLSEVYFKKIFPKRKSSKNKDIIRDLLNKYSSIYLSNEGTNEDVNELNRLERNIKEKLKEYKYFRVIAITRYDYEKEMDKKEVLEGKFEQEKLNDIDSYNQEYDEYLSSQEYDQMAGKEDNKVLIPRKR